MTQFQNVWSKVSEKVNGAGASADGSGQESEDATMKAAGKVAEAAGHTLSHEQKKKAGPLVHYGFGTAMGALYGTIAELGPSEVCRHPILSGMGFGSMLFAGADEVAVPAAGLSGKPSESPASAHIYALASHLVYGATTGALRRIVRAAI
jgi:putative membrane protein